MRSSQLDIMCVTVTNRLLNQLTTFCSAVLDYCF